MNLLRFLPLEYGNLKHQKGHKMSTIYPVPESFKNSALLDKAEYERVYTESVENNEAFWSETARRLDWFNFPTKIKDVSFDRSDLHIRWYEDGVLNACYNCVDRHLETRGHPDCDHLGRGRPRPRRNNHVQRIA